MTIVTNTGSLIALAKIDKLTLLKELYTVVSIPPAVHRELLGKSGPEVACLDEALSQFINVTVDLEVPAEVKIATAQLDAGEQQAIALAYEMQTLLVMMKS